MDIEELIKKTSAYKIVASDVEKGNLNHAYLLVCSDGEFLRSYLKIFASLIAGGEKDDRIKTQIEKEIYPDCTFYPSENGGKILTDDAEDLISKLYIKPLENTVREFVFVGAENMNVSAQNKLLKTLEEPPKNVCILLGAVSDSMLLSTVKSRVKRLEINGFSYADVFQTLIKDYSDAEKIKRAINLSDGKLSDAIKYLRREDTFDTVKLCRDILMNMTSSKEVYRYVKKVSENLAEFVSVMKNEIIEILKSRKEGNIDGYPYLDGALISVLDKLTEKEKTAYYNANVQMTADYILFGMVEEKFKWQKLSV